MGILDKITEKDNLFIKDIESAISSGYKTYIYGDGYCASQLKILIENNSKLKIEGILLNRNYLDENTKAQCLEDFFDCLNGKINIIVGFYGYNSCLLEKYMDKINMVIFYKDSLVRNVEIDPIIRGYDYYKEVSTYIDDSLYNKVADDKSKKTVEAYINQRISMKYGYLSEVLSRNQYFDDEIIKLNNDEVFIDCGAYDGDSALGFSKFAIDTVGGYKKIISFEPDVQSFIKLKGRGIQNHICINKGVSDRKESVYFLSNDQSSYIAETGSNKIELDTIDNVVQNENVTFIKMDIEGAELAALRGAENTITRCKPKLAICIYHKPEDMWEITDYILKLVPDYKLYVRIYRDAIAELVLYAI